MLFEPFDLAGLTLRNRLVLAPMALFSSNPDGTISDEEVAYLRRRGKGFGLLVAGACYVHRSGLAWEGQWGCHDDAMLPSLKRGAEAIIEGGAKAFVQIHHGGLVCRKAVTGMAPWAPSDLPPAKEGADAPVGMSEAQVAEIVEAFAKGALRAKKAGFDGVELHGANGYLLQQFVSPATNHRTDAWGKNRLSFPLAVLDAVLESVGPDLHVGYRLSPEEGSTPGLRMSDTLALIDELCKRPVAYIHLSTQDHRVKSLVGEFDEPALAVVAKHLAGRKPLIGVGGVKLEADARDVLSLGADLVGVARASLTEADWPQKIQAGETPRPALPRKGAAQLLDLPTPLVDRMIASPGWVEVEPEE